MQVLRQAASFSPQLIGKTILHFVGDSSIRGFMRNYLRCSRKFEISSIRLHSTRVNIEISWRHPVLYRHNLMNSPNYSSFAYDGDGFQSDSRPIEDLELLQNSGTVLEPAASAPSILSSPHRNENHDMLPPSSTTAHRTPNGS